jgi:hypothetical protein
MAWRVAELFLPYSRNGISSRMLKKPVQQGRSELSLPLFFSILLRDDVAHKIVQSRIGDLDLDELPCGG